MKIVNPYTFVPFGDAVPRQPFDDYYSDSEGLLSGYLDVDIIVKKPIIIPDASEAEDTKVPGHRKYPFFRVDGKPAIPGSEIRGMIRSSYEAATDSCLPFLSSNKSFSLRTPTYGSFKNRGVLECSAGTWSLYDAIVTKKRSVENLQ